METQTYPTSEPEAGSIAGRSGTPRAAVAPRPASPDAGFQRAVTEWIRSHKEAAMLVAFAFGVFVGAWMRN